MSPEQGYQLVYNFMSLAIASMGASFFFFISARGALKEGNRMAVTLSATVVLIAFYHYVRIFDSWVATAGGSLGEFNEAYRYVDWLLTVPLLVAELILVLRLDKKLESKLIQRNVVYAFLMIATGYIGEMDNQTSVVLDSSRTIWGAISTIFFVLILRDLFGGIDASFKKQSKGWGRTCVEAGWIHDCGHPGEAGLRSPHLEDRNPEELRPLTNKASHGGTPPTLNNRRPGGNPGPSACH